MEPQSASIIEPAQGPSARPAGPSGDLLSIVRLLPDVLFRCERRADGKIYWTLNEGRLAEEFHLTTDEIRDRPLDTLFPPEVVARLLPEFERSFAGEAHEFYNELGGRTFKHFPQPVRDESGRVVAVVGFISDVTSLVKAEAQIRSLYEQVALHAEQVAEANRQLSDANRELEAFGFTVSHDLRSPLTVMDSVNQLLLTKYADGLDPEALGLVRRSSDSLRRMSQLIEDLLKFSRTARGDLEMQEIDLSSLVQPIVEELARSEPGRTVEVEARPGGTAHADPRLMRIALENLLRNAWKFTRKEPHARIEFGWSGDGDQRVFHVRDNGAGFDPARADRLFHAFERLHSTNEFEGTGVGLSTVQRILRRHGGRIWAEGAVGQGATFNFTLPAGGAKHGPA
jgi:signal transduction histidine kinase